MNNSLSSISFSIFSNKGIYALLLGSGISRNSGIPTGWDIVIDLIKKLAVLKNEKCEPTPQEWFEKKFGIEANYSTILGELAKTPGERLNLLKPYFESSKELQQPSKAHSYIAKLIKGGYIKVVITTNFDRLLENALRNEGIEPTIIKHHEDIKGALPIVHNKFTLIKLNGDYLDSRFLNTAEELSEYNSELRNYVLNIINEFGIISCGWSAKWDTGLISILRQSENFRFSSYWSFLGVCESELYEIAKFRKGETLEIANGDSFFEQIFENIEALEKLSNNHPLSADIATARIKKYLSQDEFRIQFHDFFFQEVDVVFNKMKELHESFTFSNSEHLKHLLSSYERNLEIVIPMIVNSVYWSKSVHYYIYKDILSRLYVPAKSGTSYWQGTENFRQFSALIVFYSLGVMAVKSGKYEILTSCFNLKVEKDELQHTEQIYLIEHVQPCHGVVDNGIMNSEILGKNYHAPVSTYLHRFLRPYFSHFIPSDKDFEKSFDIFEYLISLNYKYLLENENFDWAPWGEYKWRRNMRDDTIANFDAQADFEKDNWSPIRNGMFGSSYETYKNVRTKLHEHLKLNQLR